MVEFMLVTGLKTLTPEPVVGTDFCRPEDPFWRKLLRGVFMKPIGLISKAALAPEEKRCLELVARDVKGVSTERSARVASLLAQNFLVEDTTVLPEICIFYFVGFVATTLFFSSVGASILGVVGLSALSLASVSWIPFVLGQVGLFLLGSAFVEAVDYYTDPSLKNVRLFKKPKEGLEGETIFPDEARLKQSLEALLVEEEQRLAEGDSFSESVSSLFNHLTERALKMSWKELFTEKTSKLLNVEDLSPAAKEELLLDKGFTLESMMAQRPSMVEQLKKIGSDYTQKCLNDIALRRFELVADFLDKKLAAKLLTSTQAQQGEEVVLSENVENGLFSQQQDLFVKTPVHESVTSINVPSRARVLQWVNVVKPKKLERLKKKIKTSSAVPSSS